MLVLAYGNALWALDPHRQIGQYGHDSWTSERGLPGEAVYQILQTKDGYLWVRTGSGLARFDGVRFVSMDAEIGDGTVKAICMSADGDLLIRTKLRTVIYRGRRFSDYLPPAPLPPGAIRVLFESREHVVYVGADHAIYRLEKNGTARELRDGTAWINAITEDGSGTIWFGASRTLFRYRDSDFSLHTMPHGTYVAALAEDHLHRLWAGTGTGLCRLDRDQAVVTPVEIPGVPKYINALLEDRRGNLWVGTGGNGIVRSTGGEISSLDATKGLTGNAVLSLFEDREGSLWIGTDSGLDRLRDTTLTTFTAREGLPANYRASVLATRDGTLYSDSFDVDSSGGVGMIRNDKVVPLDRNAEISRLRGTSLFQSKDGAVWLGTNDGLARLQDGKLTVYTGDGRFYRNFISAISEDDEGLLVANSETVFRFQDGKVSPFTIRGKPTIFAQEPHFTSVIYRDPSGLFWFGTAEGLYKMSPGVASNKGFQRQVDFDVTTIFDDHQGSLWLGGRTAGLTQFRIGDGRVTHYTKRDGLFDGFVSHVLADDDGNLWMSAEDGIYRVSRKDLEDFADGRTKVVPSRRYGLADGMRTTEAPETLYQPSGARTEDGRLWFATVKGLTVVDPSHILHNNRAPPVVIESVVTDGTVHDRDEDLSISPGMKSVEFHYTGLSLLVPERVRFKYRLEGYDREWVDAGPRRVAYYTNLPPGTYRFHVIAANDDGLWNNQGAFMNIVLLPHFYQTLLFYLVCGMFAVVLLIAANRRNTYLIRARAEHLSRVVDERTAELRESQRELEQIAHYDALTTLPNRRRFGETFGEMRDSIRQPGDGFFLLLIDFDRFKSINDTHGHDAGDAFLIEASRRLCASVRATDCVARMGGDEFAILLTGDWATLERVCNRIVQSFVDEILFNGIRIRSSASVGVAIFPQHGETQEKLYKSADLALYEVKRKGKNNWQCFSSESENESLLAHVTT